DHVLVRLQAPHPERLHDLIRAIARVDQNRPWTSENQKSIGRHPTGAAAIAAEDEKARFELDIAVVENLDFERHTFSSLADDSARLNSVDARRSIMQSGERRFFAQRLERA